MKVTLKVVFIQFDSVVFSASGETDGGMTVSASMELDNDNPATGAGMDNRSFSFGSDSMGTVTFSGHGGVSVMGAWDDITPNAYEEVWDGTSGADSKESMVDQVTTYLLTHLLLSVV